MSAAPRFSPSHLFGGELTKADLLGLRDRWIRPEDAGAALLRRVDSITGREMFSRKSGHLSGILIPNVRPGDDHVREYRLRLDKPELEYRTDGTIREGRKYLQPPGRPNLVYFPPTLPAGLLDDTNVPAVITEGEFKCLALWRLAFHNSDSARFVPLSIAGVWNFLGTTGKTTGPDGDRRDVKGVLQEIKRIAKGRRIVIAYDADYADNPKVLAARATLARALIDLGAEVAFLEWAAEEGKGIDDRLAAIGPDRVLADIDALQFGD